MFSFSTGDFACSLDASKQFLSLGGFKDLKRLRRGDAPVWTK